MEHNVQGRQVYLLNGSWQRIDRRGTFSRRQKLKGQKFWLPDSFVPHDLGKLYLLDSHRVVLDQGELIGNSWTPPGCILIALTRMALKIQEMPQENPYF